MSTVSYKFFNAIEVSHIIYTGHEHKLTVTKLTEKWIMLRMELVWINMNQLLIHFDSYQFHSKHDSLLCELSQLLIHQVQQTSAAASQEGCNRLICRKKCKTPCGQMGCSCKVLQTGEKRDNRDKQWCKHDGDWRDMALGALDFNTIVTVSLSAPNPNPLPHSSEPWPCEDGLDDAIFQKVSRGFFRFFWAILDWNLTPRFTHTQQCIEIQHWPSESPVLVWVRRNRRSQHTAATFVADAAEPPLQTSVFYPISIRFPIPMAKNVERIQKSEKMWDMWEETSKRFQYQFSIVQDVQVSSTGSSTVMVWPGCCCWSSFEMAPVMFGSSRG